MEASRSEGRCGKNRKKTDPRNERDFVRNIFQHFDVLLSNFILITKEAA
jgi:hypothetical protein